MGLLVFNSYQVSLRPTSAASLSAKCLLSALYWLSRTRLVVVQCNLGTPITGFNESSCFLSCPPTTTTTPPIHKCGWTKLEKTWTVSACCNTYAALGLSLSSLTLHYLLLVCHHHFLIPRQMKHISEVLLLLWFIPMPAASAWPHCPLQGATCQCRSTRLAGQSRYKIKSFIK